MTLSLVGDRKSIQPQNLFINYPSSSTSLPSPMNLLLRASRMVLKRTYGNGESTGKPANPGSRGKCSVSVCVFVHKFHVNCMRVS